MSDLAITENLSFSYPGSDGADDIQVFKDLNITVKQGSFTAILGTNGCGKSTFAKLLNGILLPSGGKVFVCGIDTTIQEKLMLLRKNVGMVFQNPDNQIVANVVEEDVAFGPENLGIASPEIRRRVTQALQQVGMYEYREHAPHLLSGGQKQRIAIAGIIAMEPQCIVFDEPTAMLDPQGRKDVMETIKALNKDKNITIVLITHHMEEAAGADRIIVLHKGEVFLDGIPSDVFSRVDDLHMIGLSAPDSIELCWQLNKEGFQLPLNSLTPEKCAEQLYDWLRS